MKEAGHNEASSYFIDKESNLWIGTKGSGLFLRSGNGRISLFYRSGDKGSDYINDIRIDGENIWLSTLNGINIISLRNKTLKVSYNMDTGLPHNSINRVLLTSDGSACVATECNRLYRIDPVSGIKASQVVMYGTLLNKILDMTEGRNGTVWAATQGNGVFELTGDSVKSLTTTNGLLANYAYSILADKDNYIWIGHERGFSKYNPATKFVKVYSNDFARGGACNRGAISESADGKILIGTTEGVIIYDGTKERNNMLPPVNNINSVTINDVAYPFRTSFTLPYRKHYTVRINFAGIDFVNPEKVFYSTYLSNYDADWTKPSSSREVTYNLRDGKYKFSLLSVNEDGLTQDNPLTMEITIARPVWRTWWFILLTLGVAAGAVVLIIRQREKAMKKREEYLEKELDARTAVVRKQKAEIELQNLEITDSINYAKRIQSSILPGIEKLKEHFRDAFIMLYPRDIVSGDFYWFEKVEEDRFILVCADSTGHGVPGAFMSMIGSTLLQDIVSRQRIFKPSEILARLDKQIFSTLNQNLEVGVSNDGMDIIVCEFTNNNRHIRFASAMRPVIIVMGGETYYIKGNRASVGGQSVIEKYFDDQEYYLNEGDAIYMFSDGLPDQFGGPDGKKMKIARLKNFISEISTLDICKQEDQLTRFYSDWKGNYDQVDDILFMGVKV
jgi:serine phosphatase RsbU (regulator of sigma subunit)